MGEIHTSKLKFFYAFGFLVYCASSLIAPAFIVNKLIFLTLLSSYAIYYLMAGESKVPSVAPVLISMIYLYGFILSWLGWSDIDLSVQFLSGSFVLFLHYPLQRFNVDIEGVVRKCALAMIASTLLFYLVFAGIIGFTGDVELLDFFNKYSLGSAGEREFSDEAFSMFHLGSAPFLYLPAVLFFREYLDEKKIKSALVVLLILITAFVSSSRGLFVAILVGFAYLYGARLSLKARVLYVVLTGVFFLVALLLLNEYYEFFSINEQSNSVKIGHAKSFFDSLSFASVVFGSGLASYYFSIGAHKYVAHTEITLFDAMRYFGWILTFIIYWLVFFPVSGALRVLSENREAFFLFLIYILLSMTNPVLFNSYGFIVVLWYWAEVKKSRK